MPPRPSKQRANSPSVAASKGQAGAKGGAGAGAHGGPDTSGSLEGTFPPPPGPPAGGWPVAGSGHTAETNLDDENAGYEPQNTIGSLGGTMTEGAYEQVGEGGGGKGDLSRTLEDSI